MAVPRYIRAISESMLPPGIMKTVKVEGRKILLANVAGTCFAMDAICNHRGWLLSDGQLEGQWVTCPGHGAVWDVRTGKAEFEEPLEDEQVYEVKVEHGSLYVKLTT